MAALWAGVGLLVAIGFVASLGRGISAVESMRADGPPPELTRLDSLSLDFGLVLGMERGTAEFEQIAAQNRRMLGKFNANPGTTLLHVGPAALFIVLAPFQFLRRVRARHLSVHRWSGRFLVALALPIGLSGLYFGLFMPFAGPVESVAIALFGTLFLFAVTLAFVAIRRGRVALHREWMIRMFSVALGVSTVRLVGTVISVITREGPAEWFAASVWIGFGITVAAGEAWIRSTRGGPAGLPGLPTPTGAALS